MATKQDIKTALKELLIAIDRYGSKSAQAIAKKAAYAALLPA
jgi:hypothetical protein